jgi:arylsulfatase A-like enzyme
MYDLEDMDLPVYADRPVATLPSTVWTHRARLDGAHLDPDRMRRIRALYYGRVTHIDDGVGQIIAELQALDLWDNTVILFISDHGDMLGDHGLSQKNVPYEASIRVPMMLRWPGRTKEGRICNDLVGHIDFLPTLIQDLDLPYPDDVLPPPGMSLLSEAGGGLGGERDGYFVDYGRGRSRWICLRTHKRKYVLWASGGMEELYNLEDDPHEMRNLLAEEPEIAREMRERVLVWEREQGLESSFDEGEFRTYPGLEVPDEELRGVVINEAPWPDNLPSDEQDSVVNYAEAFTRAIAKETTLSADKLSLADYKRKGGKPLVGTPWEDAWRSA